MLVSQFKCATAYNCQRLEQSQQEAQHITLGSQIRQGDRYLQLSIQETNLLYFLAHHLFERILTLHVSIGCEYHHLIFLSITPNQTIASVHRLSSFPKSNKSDRYEFKPAEFCQ